MKSNELNDEQSENASQQDIHHEESPWGRWLFRATMIASLIFMWWLVIYDHGVVSHH